MIYTNQPHLERQRIVSGEGHRTIKSPVRLVRVSTSPNKFYPVPSQRVQSPKLSGHQYQPYHYQPKIQQSSAKLKYFAQSPTKPLVSQTVYVTSPTKKSIPQIHVPPVIQAPSKPMTLRERLWAKNKDEPVEEYNIWQGYDSTTSIPEAPAILSPRDIKSSEMLTSNSSWNFRKKSIISKPILQTVKPQQIKRLLKNEPKYYQRKPITIYK